MALESYAQSRALTTSACVAALLQLGFEAASKAQSISALDFRSGTGPRAASRTRGGQSSHAVTSSGSHRRLGRISRNQRPYGSAGPSSSSRNSRRAAARP
jgi:hypothetical protein